jgi:hypothetical protein
VCVCVCVYLCVCWVDGLDVLVAHAGKSSEEDFEVVAHVGVGPVPDGEVLCIYVCVCGWVWVGGWVGECENFTVLVRLFLFFCSCFSLTLLYFLSLSLSF